jgi:hypothetical protein
MGRRSVAPDSAALRLRSESSDPDFFHHKLLTLRGKSAALCYGLAMVDLVEAAIVDGAVAALRRRAERQAAIAATADRGGTAATAARIAAMWADLANELQWFGVADRQVP